MAPVMYVFFYVLSVVEYIALVQAVIRLRRLRRSISEEPGDLEVARAGPVQLKGGRHRAVAQA